MAMWQIYGLVAMDLARERAAAARHAAWVDRATSGRPSALRRLFARTLRGVSDAAGTLASASASAARSVEGAG
jgi:hypothetical protein